MAGARFLTTLPYRRRAAWVERAEIVDPGGARPDRLIRAVVARAARHRVVVLNGSVRADQIAATLIRRRPHPPAIVLADATWTAGSSRSERALRSAAIRALDGPHVHYCVLSSEETRLFSATWRVDPDRVHFTPFHWIYSEEELALPTGPATGVFAGGDSLRDYAPLLAAAAGLPAEVTIATRRSLPDPVAPNVHAGPVSGERYAELFRRAAVIVVPLDARRDRSAGQQTYLNAMALGKPVVVTDALGVRDHVTDGETGLIVPPRDPAALRKALDWLLDPSNAEAVATLAERGRHAALERFGPDDYVRGLLEVVDDAARRLG